MPYFIGYIVLSFLNAGASMGTSAAIMQGGHPHSSPLSIIIGIAIFVLVILYRFAMKNSLEQHFNGPEPLGLRLGPVMTFFFGGLYFQYHFNRINEMTFNASLVREMAGIATITSLVESGKLTDDRYTAVRFHQISAEPELAKMGALSKMNTERSFVQHLHRLGYDTADRWVAENFERIGWESTIDVLEKYM